MGAPGDTLKRSVGLSQIVTVVTAVAIALAILLATFVITSKLGALEANLQPEFKKDPTVCGDAGPIKTHCLLDQDLTARRYSLAASGVIGALWTRFFTCVSALIMVAVGSIFILMKLEVKQGEAELKGGAWEIGLKTSSPGLALTLIGAALLVAAAHTPAKFDMADGPVFLSPARMPEPSSEPLVKDPFKGHGEPPGPASVPPKDSNQ
jgi:hypothetical protein